MSPIRSVILAGSLAALAQAFTQPTTASWGPLLTPDLSSPVTQGETFDVTWDPESHPTDGVTVSLVLCHGPSTNCQTAPSAIVEGVPASLKSYSWSVPCDLAAGTQSTDTGYGMLIIVDGTGEFQCKHFPEPLEPNVTNTLADSTQFSVLSSPKCSSSSTASTSASSNTTSTSVSPGGWTSVAGPGQGGYSSGAWNGTTTTGTMSTTSASMSAPSSIVYATSSAAAGTLSTVATAATSYASASPATPAASASSFPGAAVKVQTTGLYGLIAGAVAMLAL